MPEGETKTKAPIPRDAEHFPYNSVRELSHIKELAGKLDVSVKPVGDVGYLIHNNSLPLVAEAPWIAFDFDDTGAQTVQDKEKCWSNLGSMGFDSAVIQYCDKAARIYVGDTEPTYEPELDMRLLTLAREAGGNGLTDELKVRLDQAKRGIIKDGGVDKYRVSPDIEKLYHETRFTSTLYGDTVDALQKLKGEGQRPRNITILTYGDPSFQAEKVFPLIEAGVVNQVWITKIRKGQFFKELLNSNPFADIPLQYTYPETPRGIGIDFKDWQIPITLFDDDPSQVKSFSEAAKDLGVTGLGVIRVRRPNVKRAETDTELKRRVGELRQIESSSFIDPQLFRVAQEELESRHVEDWVIGQINKMGGDIPPRAVELLANVQKISIEEAKEILLARLGYKHALTLTRSDQAPDESIWVKGKG